MSKLSRVGACTCWNTREYWIRYTNSASNDDGGALREKVSWSTYTVKQCGSSVIGFSGVVRDGPVWKLTLNIR